jgi:hypothetical protein
MRRVTITTITPVYAEVPEDDTAADVAAANLALEDLYNDTAMAELVAAARATGQPVVRFEVAYPGDELEHPDGGTVWDRSGDAVEVDLRTVYPTVRTLTSEEWAAG